MKAKKVNKIKNDVWLVKGCKTGELHNGHFMILSGIKQEERAQAGVGCIIRKEEVKYLKKWEYISERILKIEFELEDKDIINMIILYGPNEDQRVEGKG